MIFDSVFFERHQKTLLVLLNFPIVGQVMRRALWIDDLWHPLTKLTPTAYHVWMGRGQYRATLYSNPQYAEVLHRSFGWMWASIHAWDMFVANRLRPAWNLGFDTYSSQPDGTAGVDTYIGNDAPTNNWGTNTRILIGEWNSGVQIARALIKFDFSSIPASGTPSSATFSLWQTSDLSSNARTFRIYRTKRDWVEAQATWNIWKTSNNWSTAGGFHVNDCEQTEIASRAMTATEANGEKQWTNFDLVLLKDMWDGDWTNNGWLIRADTEVDDMYEYQSSDSATAAERPKLVIEYTVMSGTATISGTMTATMTANRYPVHAVAVPRNTWSVDITKIGKS